MVTRREEERTCHWDLGGSTGGSESRAINLSSTFRTDCRVHTIKAEPWEDQRKENYCSQFGVHESVNQRIVKTEDTLEVGSFGRC